MVNRIDRDIVNQILARLADQQNLHVHFHNTNADRAQDIDGEIELIFKKKVHFFCRNQASI